MCMKLNMVLVANSANLTPREFANAGHVRGADTKHPKGQPFDNLPRAPFGVGPCITDVEFAVGCQYVLRNTPLAHIGMNPYYHGNVKEPPMWPRQLQVLHSAYRFLFRLHPRFALE